MRTIEFATWTMISLALVAGCSDNKAEPFTESFAADKYRDFVPPTAQVVAEGTGPLKYTPETKGTLYLVDLDDMRKVKESLQPHVIISGSPIPGSEITFDPQTASLSRAGKSPQKLTTITPGHRYQLRWMPAKPE